MGKRTGEDVIGSTIRGLTVVELIGVDESHKMVARFKCLCGVEFRARISNVKSGCTKSCGCLQKTTVSERNYKHGLSRDTRFQVWVDMHKRCYNQEHPSYPNYGGRGLKVHQSWHGSPAQFLIDMGERPNRSTLERKNNDVGYEPGNCVWAPMSVQQNNKRTNVLLTLEGETHTIADWSRIKGLGKGVLSWRLASGWPDDALLSPSKSSRRKP